MGFFPTQVSKADELAVSLAAHQEWHLKQAEELQECHTQIQQCHTQIQQLEEETQAASCQLDQQGRQLSEALHAQQLAEAEVRAREERYRALVVDREGVQHQLMAALATVKVEQAMTEALRHQVSTVVRVSLRGGFNRVPGRLGPLTLSLVPPMAL